VLFLDLLWMLTPDLYSDYQGPTADNRIELKATFEFLGALEPSKSLRMLRYELTVYGLRNKSIKNSK
jgi:hypothetical protein